jgi:hypothetical protein
MYSKDVPNTLLRVHTDHLGTVRAVSQGNGATRKVLWRFEGDAFGTAQATNPTATVLTMLMWSDFCRHSNLGRFMQRSA